MPTEKTCSRCNQTKPSARFKKRGYQCLDCLYELDRIRLEQNPEKKASKMARSVAWAKSNRDRINAAQRAKYASDEEYRGRKRAEAKQAREVFTPEQKMREREIHRKRWHEDQAYREKQKKLARKRTLKHGTG